MRPDLANTVPATGVAMTIFTPHIRAACLLAVAVVTLGGCLTSAEKPEEPNVFPAQYKQEIVETLTKLLDDPTNLREAGVTDPALRDVAGVQRYVNCVKFNPR